jgi:hypothetical protein
VKKKAEKSSEAEFFKHMKIKYHTHLKMAMKAETYSETVKTITIKLHTDRNLQYPLNNTVQHDAKILFQSLCLAKPKSESTLSIVILVPKFRVSFNVRSQL